MTIPFRLRSLAVSVSAFAAAVLFAQPADAQGGAGAAGPMRQAAQLDTRGATAEARAIFQTMIDSAADPAAEARARRAMAMSYAFDGDCANTAKYEMMVIAYWMTREAEEPQNAFY
ncbi:MAG: hypothetical protein OER90_19095, partial [Gemmatimonadota bacterium]|nr:hypothetical protein [Gemmatimonadota bacterium]